MRFDGDGHDRRVRPCWRGRGSLIGRGVFRRRRGHGAQAADGGALGARDHGGGGVAAVSSLLRGVLRAGAGAAGHARQCGGPRDQGMTPPR